MLIENEQTIIKSLVSHYKNIIHIHGHSHLIYELQEIDDNKDCNYSYKYGSHEIHVPSSKSPRTIGSDGKYTNYDGSEGLVVDVYSNYIIAKGFDFVNMKFIPVAYYCLDTNLKTINANTYTDSTGIINTSSTYSITNNLSNATNSNNSTSVTKKGSYSATITPSANYNIQSINVTMGGVDVTSSCVSNNNISISSVTGDVVITVTTVATVKTYNITNNLTNATNSNSATNIAENTSYNATIKANSGYIISSITITMAGTDITNTVLNNNVINISSVTGNIVITATAQEPPYEQIPITWELGRINSSGQPVSANQQIRTADYIQIDLNNYNYYLTVTGAINVSSDTSSFNALILQGYDANKTNVRSIDNPDTKGTTFKKAYNKLNITSALTSLGYIKMSVSKFTSGTAITTDDGDRIILYKKAKA